jgi:dTDP-glucose 4,6-dehydratase
VGSDKLAESFFRAYGLPAVVLRPFNAYGPRQSPRAVIPAIIIQAMQSRQVRLGSVAPKRDFTFVKDTARGFIAASSAPNIEGQTIQLGSQTEVSIQELVEHIGKILNKKLDIISEAGRRRPKNSEVTRLLASNQKAKEQLDWRPEISLIAGLEKTVHWFQGRSEFYKSGVYHV